MTFTDEEIETIKALINDWGHAYALDADCDKVNELGVKLGIRKPILPPTEEELAKQKAFRESPYGVMMANLFKATNESFANKMANEIMKDHAFMDGEQWPEGTPLRIRMPKDYNI